MKVLTQFGMLDINPADVVSIRPAPVLPDNMDYCDLTYHVEFDDRFYSLGDHVVCISESDAEKLAELSGIEITERKIKKPEIKKTIFVPFKKLLILNEWEKYFKNCVKGTNQEPEQKPAPSSFSSGHRMFYEENQQPISVIEKAFRSQNNCIRCGRLVYDTSMVCSLCGNKPGVIGNRQ